MKFKDFKRLYISGFTIASVCIFSAALLIKFFAVIFAPFADFVNRYVSSLTRAVLSYITAILPFSLAEMVIITMIPLALLYLLYCAVSVSKNQRLTRHIFNLIGIVCLLLSVFTINFSIAYDCTPIEEKTDLDTSEITSENVYDACIIALDEMRAIEGSLARGKGGTAVMPYSFDEMAVKLNSSYDRLYDKYTFLSPLYVAPKRIALSKPMTYTGIAGVYTFFTGEANVNMNFPDYSVAFTAAHEMAHQRGIAPEDEANFVAFLACYNSGDDFLKYSSLVEIANFLSNSLYYSDRELFEKAAAHFTEGAIEEYKNYSEGYAPYSDNIVNDVADDVNDTYLKSQGQSAGSESYGLVTTLAAAYILQNCK